MAERAHPDLEGFGVRYRLVMRRGLVPWIRRETTDYGDALRWRYRWVSRHARNHDVLDVPCGMGWGTSMIRGARSLTGIDLDDRAVHEARQRYGSQTVRFAVASMAKLPFADASFDLVCCLEGIEHVPTDVGADFLREAARVLRPGGRLMLSSPYRPDGQHSGNPYHVYEYPPQEIRSAISRYLTVTGEIERDVDTLAVRYFEAVKPSMGGSDGGDFRQRVLTYVDAQFDSASAGYRSVPGGEPTLYGTCYALLTRHYVGDRRPIDSRSLDFIVSCQDPATGYFIGPELQNWSPPPESTHDLEHLRLHLTCAALPTLQQFGRTPRYPLKFAEQFVDSVSLGRWLDRRDMGNPWLEGNNLLFAGQLLIYLSESDPSASRALETWFDWLDGRVDPATGLWGTQHGAAVDAALFGGYHQLLAYFHQNRAVKYPAQLQKSALSIQHRDGGFCPYGGGGACEDVDAVDVLVNLYKQMDRRRATVRGALRRCMRQILSTQNSDGGFPYKPAVVTSHMGIPATVTAPGGSGMFPTWFRVHTLALMAEVLTDEPVLASRPFGFNTAFSMGWHRPWDRAAHPIRPADRLAERLAGLCRSTGRRFRGLALRAYRTVTG